MPDTNKIKKSKNKLKNAVQYKKMSTEKEEEELTVSHSIIHTRKL